MIDRRLRDEESRQFRHAWYVYSVISLVVISIVAAEYIWSMTTQVNRFLQEQNHHMQSRMICDIAVELLHLYVTVRVAYGFVSPVLNPLREAAGHKAQKFGRTFIISQQSQVS